MRIVTLLVHRTLQTFFTDKNKWREQHHEIIAEFAVFSAMNVKVLAKKANFLSTQLLNLKPRSNSKISHPILGCSIFRFLENICA
jgi:hypothetical protein